MKLNNYLLKAVSISIAMLSASFISTKEKPKKPSDSKYQIAFVSEETSNQLPEATQEDLTYCIETLKNFAKLQEQRQLTLEEITMAMRIMLFLQLSLSNHYDRKIVFSISGKQLTLPYSEDLFAGLLSTQKQPE